ncbi:MAG: hypothetical protein ACWA5W_06660 [Phycisphaerales bacterium]
MGLTTERKIFLGLATVAVAALIIDQGILSPGSASAQSSTPVPVQSVPVSLNKPTTKATKSSSPSDVLIKRIESAVKKQSSDVSMDSLFAMTQFARPEQAEHDADESDQTEQTFPVIVATPGDLPELSSVMPSANGGGAVLSGKLLRVGDVSDSGYRLLQVYKRSVLIEKDHQQYVVELPMTIQAD